MLRAGSVSPRLGWAMPPSCLQEGGIIMSMKKRLPLYLVLAGVLIAMVWVVEPFAEGHEPEHLEVCLAEDSIGDFSFPVAGMASLRELCDDIDGRQGVVDAPPVDELVNWMFDLGLYDPYWLGPIDAEDFFGPLPSPEPGA